MVISSRRTTVSLLFFLVAFTLFSVVNASASGTAATADWTVLSYIAADNNLEKNAIADINEMEKAGPGPNVNIIIQFDRPAGGYNDGVNTWDEAVRIKIQKDGDPAKISSPVVARLGKIDSGSPASLSDFIAWGVKNYPAKRYILVLWSHGSGWKTVPYDPEPSRDGKGPGSRYLEKMKARPGHYVNNLKSLNPLPLSRSASPLLPGGMFPGLERSICYDDTSKDSIKLNDLSPAIKKGCEAAGLKGFDIIWFDACLMSMLEVAYSISDCGNYMVASEEVTPDSGWNHVKIVNLLNKSSQIPTADIAKLIVSKFIEGYKNYKEDPARADSSDENDDSALPVTMQALDLSKTRSVIEALDGFVAALSDPVMIPAISDALNMVQRFNEPDFDYIDLKHFADIMSNSVSGRQVQTAYSVLQQKLAEMVISSKTNSSIYKHANGITVYFPLKKYDAEYDRISFASRSSWPRLIKTYLFPGDSHVLTCAGYSIVNPSGDGRLIPADRLEFKVKISNVGSKSATNARIGLVSRSKAIRIENPSTVVPEIKPNSFAEAVFVMSSAGTKPGQQVQLELLLDRPGADSSVRLATFKLDVKAPFIKNSDILVVFGHGDQAVEKSVSEAFAAAGKNFDTWKTETDGIINLPVASKYFRGGVVFRVVPDSSVMNKITREEIAVWEGFLKSGGSLCISGQDIGAMIGETNLYRNYFKCNFGSDSGGTFKLTGEGLFAGQEFSLNGTDCANNQIFIDDIVPGTGAETIFKYDNGKPAGIFVDNKMYRLVYTAFGIEAINGTANRAEVIKKIVSALPLTIQNAVANIRESSKIEDSSEKSGVASANTDLTIEKISEGVSSGNYEPARRFLDSVSEISAPSEREPFIPLLKSVGEMLKAHAIQRGGELNEGETASLKNLINRCEKEISKR